MVSEDGRTIIFLTEVLSAIAQLYIDDAFLPFSHPQSRISQEFEEVVGWCHECAVLPHRLVDGSMSDRMFLTTKADNLATEIYYSILNRLQTLAPNNQLNTLLGNQLYYAMSFLLINALKDRLGSLTFYRGAEIVSLEESLSDLLEKLSPYTSTKQLQPYMRELTQFSQVLIGSVNEAIFLRQ